MNESYFDEIRRYVGFERTDEEALRRLAPAAEPALDSIVDEFYERIRAHRDASAVLRSDAQVQRLEVSLRAWLDRLLRGPWDEAYYERRARIGHVHVEVGLPQRYMLTAMSVIRQRLDVVVDDTYRDDEGARRAASAAIDKILDLDLAIMLETYREDSMDALRRLDRLGRDILERRLEISEARYVALVETAEVLVIGLDEDGRIAIFNRAAEAATGYTRAEVIGRPWVEVACHPDDAATGSEAIATALNGASRSLESRLVTRAGAERIVRWHITPLPAYDLRALGITGIDLTDERSLATRASRAERLASLGTLAAGLAHEIRNPLNAAKLQLALAERRVSKNLDGDPRDGILHATGVVRDELGRLAELVHDFLAFARPSALQVRSADLRVCLAEVVRFLTPDADEAGVTLEVGGDQVVAALFDPERLKQVAHNLIRNAIEAAGRGGRVEIAIRRDREHALVEVSDTGPGLPEDIDIFEPFATKKEGGTGLGLPIVHRIVSAHGGDIAALRSGDRTVFRIELPIDGPGGGG